MLKFPKLLRKQYLNHSPIWKAYLNGASLPPECFMINTKLFSAYSMGTALNITNILNPNPNNNTQYPKPNININNIITQLHNLKQNQQQQSQSITKTQNFLISYNNQDTNHPNNIYQLYRNIYKHIQYHKSNKLSTHLSQYVSFLVTISEHQCIDDIDVLILYTFPISISQLTILDHIRLQWNVNNTMTTSIFKYIILKQLCMGNWHHIPLLKRYLNKLKYNIHAHTHNQCISLINTLLKCMHNIISSRNSMQDIDRQSISLLLTPIHNIIKPKQLLSYQYLLFMDWLAVKILYRSTRGAFISNLQQFYIKYNYMHIPHLLQLKHNNNNIMGIYKQQQLCKLQIITFLYNTIVSCATDNINRINSIGNVNGKHIQYNLEKVAQLRQLKIQQQKLIQRIFDMNMNKNKNKKTKNKQSMQYNQLISNICYIGNVLDIVQIQIKSQVIRKLIYLCIQQIINYDIILLNASQLHTINKMIQQVSDTVENNNRIKQYNKKIQKYLTKQPQNIKQIKPQQIKSKWAAKILWKRLKQYQQPKSQENKQKELSQLKQNIFLLSGQQPTPIKQPQPNRNIYITQIKQLFQ